MLVVDAKARRDPGDAVESLGNNPTPQSPRTQATERLRGRVVVDTEVLRDPADTSTALEHGSADQR